MEYNLKLDNLTPEGVSSLSGYLANEPFSNIVFVTLPIWLPMLALAIFGVCRSVLVKCFMWFGIGLRRVWLGYGAAFTVLYCFLPTSTLVSFLSKIPGISCIIPDKFKSTAGNAVESNDAAGAQSAGANAPVETREWMITTDDLEKFKRRIEGGPEEGVEWEEISNKKTDKVRTVSWRHILPNGSTEYLTRSVFENARPDDMFAFYNCDRTRLKWDKMFDSGEVLEVDEPTGAEAVRWVRNYPAWCSQRDYVFGRRSWLEAGSYWTITKGCTHPDRPAVEKPKRVDDYFSSWRISQVEGRDGQNNAVEVMFMHYEDFKIQQDMARMAIRMGLWGVLQNLSRGFYDFAEERQGERNAGAKNIWFPAFQPYSGSGDEANRPAGLPNASESADSARINYFNFGFQGKKATGMGARAVKLGLGLTGAVLLHKGAGGMRRRAAVKRAEKLQLKL